MINLLPPEEKRRLETLKNLKKGLVLLVICFFWLISISLILFAIKVDLQARVSFEEELLKQTKKEFTSSKQKNIERKTDFYKKVSKATLESYQGREEIVSFLQDLREEIPEGITLKEVRYVAEEESNSIRLRGVAKTRGDLLSFRDVLKEGFKEVEIPPSNWVESQDIDFQVSFKWEKNEG